MGDSAEVSPAWPKCAKHTHVATMVNWCSSVVEPEIPSALDIAASGLFCRRCRGWKLFLDRCNRTDFHVERPGIREPHRRHQHLGINL